ncbi:MAG: hypothetical protein ACRDSN_16425 [Pseudonocardiaceae bacterium]
MHNPEQTLAELAPEQGHDSWAAACTALDDMATAGWCRSWGVACWDGGQATHPVWDVVDARQFLQEGQDCSPIPAAFRVAYELPQISRVAVSTSRSKHLAELVAATALDADDLRIARYRALLRAKVLTTEAS